MKKTILFFLCGLFAFSGFACNLQFESKARTSIYDLGHNNFGSHHGNAFHHIIPYQRFVGRINEIFNGQNLAIPGGNPRLRDALLNMANQLMPDINVPFRADGRWPTTIAEARLVLEQLGNTGRDLEDQPINGIGGTCDIGDENGRTSEIVSYLPVDGFIGPTPLLDDPGDNFDTYGFYFKTLAIYNAMRDFNEGNNLINNFELMLTYGGKVAAYDQNLWMLAPNVQPAKICYRDPLHHPAVCRQRPH